ncbi:hypothetical protein D9613_006532 [Agrocybe pediades]|uniref:F-box domain-containing protein n=1 Tax=Agrocybe pediades TaxID=84607 RepID=A0A8H4QGD9_9AGAR|nr:hypothetical protein D9613_006532 [Agrocybe pediades]
MSISTLNHDILYHLFDIIVSYVQLWSSLDVLRYASQVCEGWRDIVLSSPILWGKCLNFDHLTRSKGAWRAEVIKRTGDALISITCRRKLNYSEPGAEDEDLFVASFIKDNWHRIRSLDIAILSPHLLGAYLETHTSPAPNLIYTRCTLREGVDAARTRRNNASQEDQGRLITLAGDAPRLRTILLETSHPDLFQLPNTNQAPWLSQLRSLRLSSCAGLSQILEILKSTPLLESLGLSLHRGKADIVPLSLTRQRPGQLLLPRLTSLSLFISVDLPMLVALLNNIDMTHLNALDIIGFDDGVVSTATVEYLARQLRRFFSACSLKGIATRLGKKQHQHLYVEMGHFNFQFLYSPMIDIRICCDHKIPNVAYLLQPMEITEIFSGVPSLYLDLEGYQSDFNGALLPLAMNPIIVKFLASFKSATRLRIRHWNTLRALERLQEVFKGAEPLPALEELFYSAEGTKNSDVQLMENFIANRVAYGKVPIARIYVPSSHALVEIWTSSKRLEGPVSQVEYPDHFLFYCREIA